jgi:hypothetical protein
MKSIRAQVQDRVALSLSPETAAVAGLSLQQLLQVPWGALELESWQVKILAAHFDIPIPEGAEL